MPASVITIGDEILSGHTTDSNFVEITRQLVQWGYAVDAHLTVPDRASRIGDALRETMGRFDPIVVTGGLGGTPDDLTLDAVAAELGRTVEPDGELFGALSSRHPKATPTTLRGIARRIEGSRSLRNPVGQAPGVFLSVDAPEGHSRIVLLPGIPQEMRAILAESVFDALGPGPSGLRTIVRTAGRGEGIIADILAANGFHGCSFLPSTGRVDLVLPAGATEETAHRIRELLGDIVFGDGSKTLAESVVEVLGARGATLAIAESLTGGALGAAITEVPGASRVFLGSFVLYADAMKRDFAGVSDEVLAREGAVSAAVARLLAEGMRSRTGADYALSTTGIAGPSGATATKPVGLVYVGLVLPDGRSRVVRHELLGHRRGVIDRTVTSALDLLRRGALGLPLPAEAV